MRSCRVPFEDIRSGSGRGGERNKRARHSAEGLCPSHPVAPSARGRAHSAPLRLDSNGGTPLGGAPRQDRGHCRIGTQADRDSLRDLARRNDVRGPPRREGSGRVSHPGAARQQRKAATLEESERSLGPKMVIACEDVRRRAENPLRPRPADCDPSTHDHPCAIESANSRLRPTASLRSPQVINNLQKRPRRRHGGGLCLTREPLHSRPRFAPRHLEDRSMWGIRTSTVEPFRTALLPSGSADPRSFADLAVEIRGRRSRSS